MHYRILVVDDEEYFCRVVRLVLEDAGYEVVHATSVAEGLRLLREECPDAITVDLKMPGSGGQDFGGLDLLEAKWSDQSLRYIPSVVLTAAGTMADEALELASHFGARTTLRKPFSQHQLIETIAVLLGI